MSRKIQRQVWRKGGSKAVGRQENEYCYREEEGEGGGVAGPPSRTRARLKRKLQQPPIPIPPATNNKPKQQARTGLNHQHQSNTNEESDDKLPPFSDKAKKSPKTDIQPTSTGGYQPSAVASSSVYQALPQKRILELVLDTLQRRDTYEIFAEPVDPKEVEDYYEIIKEPMDFGTMRAKLHEGMYTTLEQFQHDVFLISGNAMHFNSSSTLFSRQARAIHELSKKVFDLLRTDPQNFVMEYSGMRRRSARRLKGEAKKLNYSKPITTHSAHARTGSAASSRGAQSSAKALSISGNLGLAPAPDFGARDGRRCSSSDEADRRCTYKPKLLYGSDSFVSGGLTNSKTLVPVNQQDISYRESLMRFVKDLGPTAKMIASRKLQGLHDTQPAETEASFPFLQSRPSTRDIISFVPDPAVKQQTSPSLVSSLSPKQRSNVKMKSSKDDSYQENSFMEPEPKPEPEPEPEPKPRQVVSTFAFDLPFLKSQLSQMKFTGENRLILQTNLKPAGLGSSTNDKMASLRYGNKLEQKGWPFCHNVDADLALQL